MKLRRNKDKAPPKDLTPVQEERAQLFDKFDSMSAIPMLVLTALMLPVLIVPFAVHLRGTTAGLFVTADYLIWTIFVIEYLIKVTLAPRRFYFITHNPLDLVVVAVPMLRPLRLIRSARLLRLLRLGRVGAVTDIATGQYRKRSKLAIVNYVAVVTGALVLMCSLVVMDLEQGAPGSNIHGFGDALWWGVSTITTVGYGDRYPVTPGGRAIAAVLMLCGIGLLGIVTAGLASSFIHRQGRPTEETPSGGNEIAARLASIEATLALLVPTGTAK